MILETNTIAERRDILVMIYNAGSGHPGGSLSAVDVIEFLYQSELIVQAERRDRFVLSKGHAVPALYAVLAQHGLIERKELSGFRKLGSPFQGHPDTHAMPAMEVTTGSLGIGFSTAIGMALGLRHQKNPSRVYVMLGDGELQEGQVWEGVMYSAHQKLSNICAIVDYNKMQSDDLVQNICGLEPLEDKWKAFGWNVLSINGHDFSQISEALVTAKNTSDKPTVIVSNTIKGKGISYMEGSPLWHGSVCLSESDLKRALEDLDTQPEYISECLEGRGFHD